MVLFKTALCRNWYTRQSQKLLPLGLVGSNPTKATMKKTLAFLFLLFCLVGCGAPAQESGKTKNGWQVEKCFEKDGYTVYRFSDGLVGWQYYVVPQGQVANVIRQGKTTRIENIQTVGE